MDFFNSLLSAYNTAEESGWVDNPKKSNPVLLPLYHSNRRITKPDTISVLLDREGHFIKAEFLPKDETIVFPVTFGSVARSGKFPPPHPLVDKFIYFVPDIKPKLYEAYHDQLDDWRSHSQDEQVKTFLALIQQFTLQEDFLPLICHSLFGQNIKINGLKVTYPTPDNKEETVDLMAMFLTFEIDNFIGLQTVSVTNFTALHKDYIHYTEAQREPTIICNISGQKDVPVAKHRGLLKLKNARIISVSNHGEAYKGRFTKREDIFTVGSETSTKIHLMLNFFLDNEHSNAWLGSEQYLINWFSDDLANESQLNIMDPANDDDDDDEVTFDTLTPKRPEFKLNSPNYEIAKSFIHGTRQFSDTSNYFIAILNKTNPSRVALKYFRQLEVSCLLQNLERWQVRYSWEIRQKGGGYRKKTPSFMEMILAAYGTDRDKSLKLDNGKFRSDQLQKLITCLIDGKTVPTTLTRKLAENIKQRQRYKNKWFSVMFVALAVLHKQNGEEFTPMLDKKNTNRSYLFGRLLAIFELLEDQKYQLDNKNSDDNKKQDRVTNAERYWSAYASQPAKLMENLTNKIKPYEETVKLNVPGIFYKLENERTEIIRLLAPLMDSKEFNAPLDYRFIFGYYAEKRFFYTKQDHTANESEE